MAGAYCRFCDHRCFVLRVLPDGSWSGHFATCAAGMSHDRAATGFDHASAINPVLEPERAAAAHAQHQLSLARPAFDAGSLFDPV